MSAVCGRHVSDWATRSVMATSLFRESMKVWDIAAHLFSTGLSGKLPACRRQLILSRRKLNRCSWAEAYVIACGIILQMLALCCEHDDRLLSFFIGRRNVGC